MTAEQHNKYLAWAHIAHAGLISLFLLAFLGMFGAMFFAMARVNFSRLLSGPVSRDIFENNSEIYLSGTPVPPTSGIAPPDWR